LIQGGGRWEKRKKDKFFQKDVTNAYKEPQLLLKEKREGKCSFPKGTQVGQLEIGNKKKGLTQKGGSASGKRFIAKREVIREKILTFGDTPLSFRGGKKKKENTNPSETGTIKNKREAALAPEVALRSKRVSEGRRKRVH